MQREILYEGKSKIVYRGPQDDTCIIEYKDTATAFNGEKKEELFKKGLLNASISNIIYKYLESNGIKTHMIEVIDDTSVVAKKAEIIPVEVIVRNYAAGGYSKKYGVKEGERLNTAVLEFCYKSDELGDPMLNNNHIKALSLATDEEVKILTDYALSINSLLTALFEKANIILADFKLEFGRCGGEVLLCDEISPDSCRLWDKTTMEKLDKDRFRRDLGNVTQSYEEVLGRLKNVCNV